MQSPKILIIDEPTKGIDVGAKKEIYDVLNMFKSKGNSNYYDFIGYARDNWNIR